METITQNYTSIVEISAGDEIIKKYMEYLENSNIKTYITDVPVCEIDGRVYCAQAHIKDFTNESMTSSFMMGEYICPFSFETKTPYVDVVDEVLEDVFRCIKRDCLRSKYKTVALYRFTISVQYDFDNEKMKLNCRYSYANE